MADRKKKDKPGVKRVPSDCPTALIAPSDYQHIYSESKKQPQPQPQRTTSVQQVKRVPSDCPTALIAPSDYQHIYSANKKQPQPQRTTSTQHVKHPMMAEQPASPVSPVANTANQFRPTSPPPERQQTDNILPQSVLDSVERFIRRQPKKYTL